MVSYPSISPAGMGKVEASSSVLASHGVTLRRTVIGLVRDQYADFGPTLAAEKLRELHGLPLGVETLRQWMIADRLWVRRKDRRARGRSGSAGHRPCIVPALRQSTSLVSLRTTTRNWPIRSNRL